MTLKLGINFCHIKIALVISIFWDYITYMPKWSIQSISKGHKQNTVRDEFATNQLFGIRVSDLPDYTSVCCIEGTVLLHMDHDPEHDESVGFLPTTSTMSNPNDTPCWVSSIAFLNSSLNSS